MKTLTIAIPTYNRAGLLKETLDILLPQMNDRVEIVILNNASPDGTLKYLETLGSAVTVITQTTNVGPDQNQYDCLTVGEGKYVWVLSDDDAPFSDTIKCILEGIDTYDPPVLFLDVHWSDEQISHYHSNPINSGWEVLSSDEGLKRMGILFTFLSCLVIRREIIDLDFVRTRFGTNLVPAAFNVSSVGRGKSIAVSTKQLLMGRGGNVGGYDAWSVFSKNVCELFAACDPSWFTRATLRTVYNQNIAQTMGYVAKMWPITARGMMVLLRYTWNCPTFYSDVLPTLSKRLWRRLCDIVTGKYRGSVEQVG